MTNAQQTITATVTPPIMRWDNYTLLAFQRIVARKAITKMAGWVAVPEFVAAVGECDRQLRLYCESRGISKEQLYAQYHQYNKEKPL